MMLKKLFLHSVIFRGFFLSLFFFIPASGQELALPQDLKVGVKEAPPFAMKDEAGEWHGIAVDLWRLVAADLKVDYDFIELTLPEVLEQVENEQLDLGVGAITVSAAREERIDFSQPFDHSGIGVAAKISDGGFTRLLKSFISFDFIKAVTALILVLALAGAAVWFAERKRNKDDFGGDSLKGIGTGFWWAAVTMTTVGYGDKAPATLAGRIVGLVWMFAGVITISGFTAAIASTLTASDLRTNLTKPSDLARVNVGAVSETIGAEALKARGISFKAFPSYQEALQELAEGGMGAVVHDQPLLIHQVKENHNTGVEVLHWLLAQQSYAFALQTDSDLQEPLNRSLLKIMDTAAWQEIRLRYLGVRHEN